MGASKPAANRIAGRVVLVTGGGGGVGRASALAFAKAGCDVAVLGRTAASLAETARLVRAFHVRATHVTADVASRPEVTAALAAVVRELGPVGVLVNAAGIAESSPTVPPDDELFDRTMAINVRGPWVVTTACLPEMRRARFGRIVHVASTAALEGSRYTAAYVASKHALLGLTRAMALDFARDAVTVNAICPGFLDTPMTARTVEKIVRATGRTPEETLADVLTSARQSRLITAHEVAAEIVRLASDPTRTGTAAEIRA